MFEIIVDFLGTILSAIGGKKITDEKEEDFYEKWNYRKSKTRG